MIEEFLAAVFARAARLLTGALIAHLACAFWQCTELAG
jgi:hypothetical protein